MTGETSLTWKIVRMFSVPRIQVLQPWSWQYRSSPGIADLTDELRTAYGSNLKTIITTDNDIYIEKEFWSTEFFNEEQERYRFYITDNGTWNNILSPDDIVDMQNYDFSYVSSHGSHVSLSMPFVEDKYDSFDSKLEKWVKDHNSECLRKDEQGKKIGTWEFRHVLLSGKLSNYLPSAPDSKGRVKCIRLKSAFFNSLDLSNSIVYLSICNSFGLRNDINAKYYLGYSQTCSFGWSEKQDYYLFHYMMYGPIPPTEIDGYNTPDSGDFPTRYVPVHIAEAVNLLKNGVYDINPSPSGSSGCELSTNPTNFGDKYYFYTPLDIIIYKE